MKRILCFLTVILTVSLLFCLPLSALAAEAEEFALGEDSHTDEPGTQTSSTEKMTQGEPHYDIADTATNSNSDTVTEPIEESVFSLVYNYVIKHSPTILSALSFLSAISVVITLKRVMMPGIKELFGRLKRESDGAKESSKEQADKLLAACDGVKSEAQRLSVAIREGKLLTEELKAALSDISATKREAGELKAVLLAELEMLYEVFMAASLPQYEKERVGERFMTMRSAILKGEKSDA